MVSMITFWHKIFYILKQLFSKIFLVWKVFRNHSLDTKGFIVPGVSVILRFLNGQTRKYILTSCAHIEISHSHLTIQSFTWFISFYTDISFLLYIKFCFLLTLILYSCSTLQHKKNLFQNNCTNIINITSKLLTRVVCGFFSLEYTLVSVHGVLKSFEIILFSVWLFPIGHNVHLGGLRSHFEACCS